MRDINPDYIWDDEKRERIKKAIRGYKMESNKDKLIALYQEYIQFLNEANETPIRIASNHGWKCPQKDIDDGIALRFEIEELLKEIGDE